MSAAYRLYCQPGWGSALVEAQLAWYGLAYETEDVGNLFESAAAREKLIGHNPLAQVPTLVPPGGGILTESAAITLYLADVVGRDDLVPRGGAAERPAFLRRLVFIVANVYPTFTYADDLARFVAVEAARQPFRQAVDAYTQKLWRQVEAACGTPHFLGARFSALDIYAAVMTCWRPRRPWFAELCPRLHAAALRADTEPRLAAVWRRNWPKG
jgi:GST-like protein